MSETPATASEPLRVAVISCGKAGRAHIHWYSADPRCQVVAVWNRTRSTADAIARNIGCRSLSSWEEAVDDPDIDLVSLCGPSSTRAEQAVRFLHAGTPILCEKPLARTLRECDAMLAASRGGRASLYCAFNMRFHPVVEAVGRMMSWIGEPIAADVSYTQFRTNVTWRHRLDQGGGVIKEQAVHVFDLLLQWMGDVVDVTAQAVVVHPDRETEDHGEVQLRFASGATGRVYASYVDPRPETMIGSVLGSQGRIDFVLSPYDPMANAVTLTSQARTDPIPLRATAVTDPVYPGLMDATQRTIGFVVDRVLDGGPSWIDGEAGRSALEIVAAAYASDQRRTTIRLPMSVPEAIDSGWAPRHLPSGAVPV